ncbi:hypothetical protein MRB53_041204 [Persea americana]|nr:hypothetical protein MRB53_041204 [Persea americana]
MHLKPPQCHKDLWEYNVNTCEWRVIHASSYDAPTERSSHIVSVVNREMYVLFGLVLKDGQCYAVDDVFALNLDSFRWRQIQFYAPARNYSLSARATITFAHYILLFDTNEPDLHLGRHDRCYVLDTRRALPQKRKTYVTLSDSKRMLLRLFRPS